MTLRRSALQALSILLPAGADSVSARLQAIRNGVSSIAEQAPAEPDADPNIVKAWWGNGGWGNGGWGWRPGWGNGGWGPGWRNGGWRNGWHNGGWHNFWRNW
jgi:rSAM-associated Gly-rich repeat protein